MRVAFVFALALAACGQTSAPESAEVAPLSREVLSCALATAVGDQFEVTVEVPDEAIVRDGQAVWWTVSSDEPWVVRHALNREAGEQPAGYLLIQHLANDVEAPDVPAGLQGAALDAFLSTRLEEDMLMFARGSCAPATP